MLMRDREKMVCHDESDRENTGGQYAMRWLEALVYADTIVGE